VPEPPRWCEWLVTACVPASPYRDALLGDLREGYTDRLVHSRAEAHRWYLRQACSIAFHYLPGCLSAEFQDGSKPGSIRDPILRVVSSDLRHAARRLGRSPAFALVVLGSLALGIGANAAIFSVVRGVLLKPLALPEPDRLIALWSTQIDRGGARGGISRQDAEDWAKVSHSFMALGTFAPQQGNIVVGGEPQRIEFDLASAGLFNALGVAPARGRVLAAEDDRPGHGDVAVVSHSFWTHVLGGAQAAIGRTVRLNGRLLTVVGVMPASFAFPEPTTALWTPFEGSPDETGPREARWVTAIGRLGPGVSLQSARGEMDGIARRLARDYPGSNAGVGVLLMPIQEALTGDVRPLLLLAWIAVGVVLLIVGANVANLTLGRAIAREPEVAVRAALGASRHALARQYLLETLALSTAGGITGIAIAALLLPALRSISATGVPLTDAITLDPWVVLYGLLLALLLGIVSGLVPALGAASIDPGLALRRAGKGALGHGRERFRAAFTTTQIALAVVVLVGAGLLIRSFERLSRVDPGFSARSGIVFRVAPDQRTYPDRGHASALYDQLEARFRTAPGITDVGAVNRLPLTGSWWTTEYAQEGATYAPGREPSASYRVVTSGYFHAIGIPLLDGRGIDVRDNAAGQRVVVISRSLANQAWPHSEAIGHRITFDPHTPGAPWYTVVGVVGDVHTSGLADAPEALAYVALPQATFGFFGDWGMDMVLRTTGGTDAAVAVARHDLHELAPDIPLFQVRPLDALLTKDLARRRLLMALIVAFAVTAALLAGLGLFAIVANGVTQRRRELGLRLALGANAARIRREVLWQGLKVAGLGLAIGLSAAAAVSRLLGTLLFQVRPGDLGTYGAVGALLLAVTLFASWLPARRASRVDPIDALRSE